MFIGWRLEKRGSASDTWTSAPITTWSRVQVPTRLRVSFPCQVVIGLAGFRVLSDVACIELVQLYEPRLMPRVAVQHSVLSV